MSKCRHCDKERVEAKQSLCKGLCANEQRKGKTFTLEEAYQIGRHLGIDFEKCGYTVEEYRTGLNIELEHGSRNPHTNVTYDDPILTGKIALAHLNEFPDYYKRLPKMEEEARRYWNIRS